MYKFSLLDDFQLALSVLRKCILVFVPQPHKFRDVLVVNAIDMVIVWVFVLHHSDWPSHNDIDRSSIRHHADIVVKDTPGMEYGNGEAHDLLDQELDLVYVWMRLCVELLVDVILTKCEDWYEISTGANCHLDKSLSPAQHQPNLPRMRVKRFASTTNDDSDGAAHALAISASFGQDVLTRLS